MSTKHTPGPWTTEKNEHGYWVGATNPTNKPVCDVHLFCIDNREPQVFSHDETLANARLIAAAPEMLEALQGVVGRSPDDWYEKVQAAIAKATGKQD